YLMSLYPGVPDLPSAIPIVLKPGELRQGVDFGLTPVATVTVAGTVIDQQSGKGVVSEITFSRQGELRGANIFHTFSDGSGKFSFKGVPVGTYTLTASSSVPRNSQSLSVDVIDKNLTNIMVVLEQHLSIKGRVSFEVNAPELSLDQLTIG